MVIIATIIKISVFFGLQNFVLGHVTHVRSCSIRINLPLQLLERLNSVYNKNSKKGHLATRQIDLHGSREQLQ